jgi:hypothetical protein
METRSTSAEAVALVGGLVFLLIAVVGGGFTAKELAIPGVPGWGRIASLVVGVALVVPYFSEELRSDAARLSEARVAASIDDSAAASRSAVHDARDRTDVSPDGVEVSGLLATTDGSQPAVGDSIEVEFTLRNAGAEPISLTDAFVGVRTPGRRERGLRQRRRTHRPAARRDDHRRRLESVRRRRALDAVPCYQLATGSYVRTSGERSRSSSGGERPQPIARARSFRSTPDHDPKRALIEFPHSAHPSRRG